MENEAVRHARSLNIASTPEGADAEIIGTIKYFSARCCSMTRAAPGCSEITIFVAVTVRDQTKIRSSSTTKTTPFAANREITGDPKTFFNEEGAATDRSSRCDFAEKHDLDHPPRIPDLCEAPKGRLLSEACTNQIERKVPEGMSLSPLLSFLRPGRRGTWPSYWFGDQFYI